VRIPAVTVSKSELRSPARAMARVRLGKEHGFTDTDDLDRFVPVSGLELPETPVYEVLDVDTGSDMRNVTPDDALETILAAGRSPLTVAEGIALVMQCPAVLANRDAFSILGSRCGDRRAPAIWVSNGRPRLGWCWAGNPHTWLGSASCGRRIPLK
jgi:Family of unknown function (DUF5701)